MLTRRRMLASMTAAVATGAAAPETDGGLVGGDELGSGVLPITLDGGVVLDVSVNGHPAGPFIFDTGSTLTTLDASFADSIGLSVAGGGHARGAKGGRVADGLLEGLSLRVGDFALPPQDAGRVAMPNHLTDRGRRPRIAGLIGLNGFGQAALKIDAAQGRLLVAPSGLDPDPWVQTVPLSAALRPATASAAAPLYAHATVSAVLDGVTLTLLVDSGFGGMVLLHEHCVRESGMVARLGKHIDMWAPGGVDGPLAISVAIGRRLDIDGVAIDEPVVVMARETALPQAATDFRGLWGDNARKLRGPDGTPIDGLLGLSALARFSPVVDVSAQRLLLTPAPRASRPAHTVWRSAGLALDKPEHGHFTVLSVIDGTPAMAAGVREGDRIMAVNDTPATDLSLGDYGKLEHVRPMTLRFASGPPRTLSAVALLP